MKHGIWSLRAPVLWTPQPNALGARIALVGGSWSYAAVETGGEALPYLVGVLDGLDTSALSGVEGNQAEIASLADFLCEEGAARVIPYDSQPPRRLVAETFLLGVFAQVLVKLVPRHVMAHIVRHLDQSEETTVIDGWMGELGESIVAAQHRAAAYPLSTTKCVPVALSTYWLLRRRRKRGTFRIAVSVSPFEAHVWVRYASHDIDPRSEAFAGTQLVPLTPEVVHHKFVKIEPRVPPERFDGSHPTSDLADTFDS